MKKTRNRSSSSDNTPPATMMTSRGNYNCSGVSDNNFDYPPCELVIPGRFVVLQGIPGDGVLNTIDTGNLMMNIMAQQQQHHMDDLDDDDDVDDDDNDVDDDDDDDVDDLGEYVVDDDDNDDDDEDDNNNNDDYQHVIQDDEEGRKVQASQTQAQITSSHQEHKSRTTSATKPAVSETAQINNFFGGLESRVPQLHHHHSLTQPSSQSVPLLNSLANYPPTKSAQQSTSTAQPTMKKRPPSRTKAKKTNPEDSFVVIEDSDESSETDTKPPAIAPPLGPPPPVVEKQEEENQHQRQQQRLKRRQQQQKEEEEELLQQWNKECLLHTKQKRDAWKLSTREAAATSQTNTSQHGHHASPDSVDTAALNSENNPNSTSSDDLWWLKDGKMRVFSELPTTATRDHCRSRRRQQQHYRQQPLVTTTLSPGMMVVATRLYVLDTVTLSVLYPHDGTSMSSADINPYYFSSAGKMGMMQVLRIEWEEDEAKSGGYIISSVDGYAYLLPGSPDNYIDPNKWIWRVTCSVGAYVREGLDLGTRHIATLPYGSFVRVTRKVVNSMGLSRLRIVAKVLLVEDTNVGKKNSKQRSRRHLTRQHSQRHQQQQVQHTYTIVEGWCSEFLNPLSGQRGNVIQPIPLALPAIYSVILRDGAVVRNNIELSSPQMDGILQQNKKVCITRRIFSEHPQDQCIERLQLGPGIIGEGEEVAITTGNNDNDQLQEENHDTTDCGTVGGWISVRLNKPAPLDEIVVKLVGTDERFDPLCPGKFHVLCYRQFFSAAAASNLNSSSHDISSIDTGSPSGSGSGECSSSLESQQQKQKQKQRQRLRQGGGQGMRQQPSQQQQSGSRRRQQEEGEKCLICLTEERNATIVHGETGHIACCLICARILKARGDKCPVCRIPIDSVVQHFWA